MLLKKDQPTHLYSLALMLFMSFFSPLEAASDGCPEIAQNFNGHLPMPVKKNSSLSQKQIMDIINNFERPKLSALLEETGFVRKGASLPGVTIWTHPYGATLYLPQRSPTIHTMYRSPDVQILPTGKDPLFAALFNNKAYVHSNVFLFIDGNTSSALTPLLQTSGREQTDQLYHLITILKYSPAPSQFPGIRAYLHPERGPLYLPATIPQKDLKLSKKNLVAIDSAFHGDAPYFHPLAVQQAQNRPSPGIAQYIVGQILYRGDYQMLGLLGFKRSPTLPSPQFITFTGPSEQKLYLPPDFNKQVPQVRGIQAMKLKEALINGSTYVNPIALRNAQLAHHSAVDIARMDLMDALKTPRPHYIQLFKELDYQLLTNGKGPSNLAIFAHSAGSKITLPKNGAGQIKGLIWRPIDKKILLQALKNNEDFIHPAIVERPSVSFPQKVDYVAQYLGTTPYYLEQLHHLGFQPILGPGFPNIDIYKGPQGGVLYLKRMQASHRPTFSLSASEKMLFKQAVGSNKAFVSELILNDSKKRRDTLINFFVQKISHDFDLSNHLAVFGYTLKKEKLAPGLGRLYQHRQGGTIALPPFDPSKSVSFTKQELEHLAFTLRNHRRHFKHHTLHNPPPSVE